MLELNPRILNDPDRLDALQRSELMDTLPEEVFDRLTRLASIVLHVPISLVSLVDADRQFFKSSLGLSGDVAEARETPLTQSICQFVVTSAQPAIVTDVRMEPLLRDNRAYEDLGVVAYAGMPIIDTDGYALGSFCAIDNTPHNWTDQELWILRTLAQSVMTEINLRAENTERLRIERELHKVEERVRLFTENSTDLIGRHAPDGQYLYASPASEELLGILPEDIVGRSLLDFVSVDNKMRVATSLQKARSTTEAATVVYQVSSRPKDNLWLETKIRAIRDPYTNEIIELHTVSRDITERQQAKTKLSKAFERERRIAETLQRSLLLTLPEDTFPDLNVATFYEPALDEAKVGGDFFDAFPLSEEVVALIVGDVSGKGLAAAARTAEIKYSLRAFLREYPDPALALNHLNDHIFEIQRLEDPEIMLFIILSVALVNTRTGDVKFSVAGAEPPLIIRSNGLPDVVPVSGIALGVVPNYAFESVDRQLSGRDTMLLATDGITEARVGPKLFGYERMVGLASQSIDIQSLHQMGQMILDGARAFSGGTLKDDTCMVLARRRQAK